MINQPVNQLIVRSFYRMDVRMVIYTNVMRLSYKILIQFIGVAFSLIFSEKKMFVFSFRKYILSNKVLRTCSAP